jgi:excisionase family DNA binding protein
MAAYLKKSAYTVREYAKAGTIPAHKLGGTWTFYLSEFHEARTKAVVDPWVRKGRRGRAA